MTEIEPMTQSCIRTKCTIDKKTITRWIRSQFPELGHDAQFDNVQDNYSGSLVFTILHTEQPKLPVGPILLEDPNKDVADGEVGE